MAFGDVVQSNGGNGTTSSVTPTLPGATTAGNVIVLQFTADDYNGTPPAFWTESTGMRQHTFHGAYLWWHLCTGSDTLAAYSIGSAVRSTWQVIEYAGPFNASPYDVSNGQSTSGGVSSPSAYTTPSIT